MSKHEKEIKKRDWLWLADIKYIDMLFFKMHCHHCGKLLKKDSVSKHGWVDPVAHSLWLEKMKNTPPDYHVNVIERYANYATDSRFYYSCPDCGSKISYLSQKQIRKLQKKYKKTILSQDIVENIPMAKKRDYTEDELFWTLVDHSDRECILIRDKEKPL